MGGGKDVSFSFVEGFGLRGGCSGGGGSGT